MENAESDTPLQISIRTPETPRSIKTSYLQVNVSDGLMLSLSR